MPLETYFAEESYMLSANKKSYAVYMISFLLNGQHCFRVYVDMEPGNLFTWDEKSSTLLQMDGREVFPGQLYTALAEKISGVFAEKATGKIA